jgi:hypothetical protein
MTISDSTLKLLDIIVKAFLGLVVTGLATAYGLYLQAENDRRVTRESKAQSIIDLASKQKDLDVQTAITMFQSLTTSYLKTGTTSDQHLLRQRLLLLRLVALNFQDVPIQLRPLFEDLDSQLTERSDRDALRAIAKEVASRQAFRLTVGGGYNLTFHVKAGDPPIELDELHTKIVIKAINKESITAEIDSDLVTSGPIGPFEVGYFSWPITDNTKLHEYRISVLLLSVVDGQATVRVVWFDSDLAADRFDIKELGRPLHQSDHSTM